MGLLECASGQRAWGGYEYYLEKRVTKVEKLYDNAYSGKVLGSSKSSYITIADMEHPRKSACSCPHANAKHYFKYTQCFTKHLSGAAQRPAKKRCRQTLAP